MKRTLLLLSVLCLLLCVSRAAGQTMPDGPPKFLHIEREELKAGTFPAHMREAHNFARMLAYAKTQAGQPAYHRVALVPMAGNVNEVTYLYPFESLDDWARMGENLDRWLGRPGPVQAYFNQLNQQAPPQREDFHVSQRAMIARYRPELSYNPVTHLADARYMWALIIRPKPGMEMALTQAAKTIGNAHREAKTGARYAIFSVMAGAPEGTLIVFEAMKTGSQMIPPPQDEAALNKAMGNKWEQFSKNVNEAAASMDTIVYAINPQMSHVPEAWHKADMAFWSAGMPPAPPSAAPAATTTAARAVGTRRRPRQ